MVQKEGFMKNTVNYNLGDLGQIFDLNIAKPVNELGSLKREK